MIKKEINCFVIMPFSQSSKNHTEEYWTNHFNGFLKPIIEELSGINVFRIEALREDILDAIVNNLVISDIVIAEITDHNPNVFWELGVRQSFRHNTIIIAEIGTDLPFDLSVKATVFYDLADKEKSMKLEKLDNSRKKIMKEINSLEDKRDKLGLELKQKKEEIIILEQKAKGFAGKETSIDRKEKELEKLEEHLAKKQSEFDSIEQSYTTKKKEISNEEKRLSNLESEIKKLTRGISEIGPLP